MFYLKLATCIPVTREPVLSQILKKWHPGLIVSFQRLSTSKRDSDIEDHSSECDISASEDKPSSPSPMPGPFPFSDILPPPPSQHHRNLKLNRSEDEVEEDIISISGKKLIYPSNLMI